ncbi:sulfate ABC transporter substrate-binding protein [Aquisphaera insulae]|uniref:sulfate ABC transporter substrate-binding protein n=1 Tax=Aquisphaera insulae TaxID=2712864 RepID=UPI00196A4BCD|nr:sulfate ABC transporter substrate-binding protein [Aquisphaera insulae]
MRGRNLRAMVGTVRLLAGFLAVSTMVSGCGGSGGADSDTVKIGAYSVVNEVFHDGLIPAFKAKWKEKTGKDVDFQESYQASGAAARSIAAGFDADLAVLSHSGDMETLVKAGKVKSDWAAGADKGILTNSLVVIGVRGGNPKGIKDWADLARPGVGVLYPDPKTSGGARWNINAIYGGAAIAARKDGQTIEQATADPSVRDLVAKVQANVVNMDPSGRQSMANFAERETGDAVVTYENEILLRGKQGKPIEYVVPPATLLIESPAAIVDSSVDRHGNRALVEAFVEFLRSAEGQKIFADYGFRPVSPDVKKADLPAPKTPFTMADLGGWARVEGELYGAKGLWTTIVAERPAGGQGK